MKERSDKGKSRGPRKPLVTEPVKDFADQVLDWFIGLSREAQDGVMDTFRLTQQIADKILAREGEPVKEPAQQSLEVVNG